MLKKVVVVGLGGSGGKTVRTAHAAIDRLLRTRGWENGVPRAWQFIHVDVPSAPDGLDPELPPTIPGTYYGMVPAGATYTMIDKSMTQGANSELALQATSGWRPNPLHVPVPISLGAGQYRALGRVVTVQSVETLDNAISAAMSRVNEGPVEGELKGVAKVLGSDTAQAMDQKTYVLIVSSMAGGSGAGMIVDVVDVALAQFGNKSVLGWLYAPDVFNDLPAISRQGVRPNALATLMEWSASAWNDEGLPMTGGLLESKGVTLGARDPDNPPAMMLVGKTNGTVTFPDQNSVYMATGRMLGALMISEKAMDDLVAYSITNRLMSSPRTDHLEFMDSRYQAPPFQAFGFGRVGLGLDLFGDYSAEWLARAAVDVLLRRHLEERQGRSDTRTDDELVQAVADRVFRHFVVECGLDERGPDSNLIIDVLRDGPRADQRFEVVKGAIGQSVVEAFPKQAPVASVVAQIAAKAGEERLAFRQELATYRLRAAEGWVEDLQSAVLGTVTDALARHGLPVAGRLLEKLVEEEVPAILDDLRGEAAEWSRWAADLTGPVYDAMAGAPATIQSGHPAVQVGVEEAAKTLRYEAEADLRLFALELVADFRQGFLVPLRVAVDDARDALLADDSPADGQVSFVQLWPEGEHVPRRFKPPLNEFLLIDPQTFATVRRGLIVDSVPGLTGDAAVAEAVAQVAQGKADADAEVAAITRPGQWVPMNDKVRPKQLAAQKARFGIALRAEDLLDYARAWIREPERAMGRFMDQSLRRYLEDRDVPVSERIQRTDRLCSMLTAALKAAKPLASINPNMVQMVHNQPHLGGTRAISLIPVRGLGETEQKVREALINALGAEDSNRIDFGDGQQTDIEIFTATQPGEALVFESVISPILDEWGSVASQPGAKQKFWQWRRSRPLTEFAPMAPAYRRSLVRGWFSARAMDILDLDAESPRIKDETGNWVAFPHPMLWDPAESYDTLPAVLKSVAVALLEARKKNSLDPLKPYFRLIHLGSRRKLSGELVLGARNEEFATWLKETANRDAALKLFDKQKANYIRLMASVKDPHDSPRAYELKGDIMGALDTLARQAADATIGGSGDDEGDDW